MATYSIAERVAFGRPMGPISAATTPQVVPRPATALVARALIAAIFLISGTAKLLDPAGTNAYIASQGLPAVDLMRILAALAEIGGGLSILFGALTRVGAIGLIVFLSITTLVFHDFWSLAGDERKTQMVQFTKNLAILGGLALLVAYGPGRYSVDAKLREPRPV